MDNIEYNVLHDAQNHRFVLDIDGKESYLQYMIKAEQTMEFLTTYVPNELRGQGYAAKVVKAGLEYARAHNLKVQPRCSYVDVYLTRHKNYQDLLV